MLSLWLPILITSIALFFASFLSWMVLELHAKDWGKIADEDEFIDVVRRLNIPVGHYLYPGAETNKEMNDPIYQEKYRAGPRGVLSVFAPANMGVNLALSFVYFLICSAIFAYLASFALTGGQDTLTVFRFVATVALLTFLASIVQHAIWFRVRIVGHVIESIAYALIAGGIFALLWPSA